MYKEPKNHKSFNNRKESNVDKKIVEFIEITWIFNRLGGFFNTKYPNPVTWLGVFIATMCFFTILDTGFSPWFHRKNAANNLYTWLATPVSPTRHTLYNEINNLIARKRLAQWAVVLNKCSLHFPCVCSVETFYNKAIIFLSTDLYEYDDSVIELKKLQVILNERWKFDLGKR